MKKLYYILTIVLTVSFLSSCTDVIDVDVPNGGERLVIEASIKWEKGTTGATQEIKLSKSTAYFDEVKEVAATGASIMVRNVDSGESFSFNESQDGVYVANNFKPVIGDTYTLEINYNGKVYNGTDVLTGVSEITDIVQGISSGFEDDQINIKIYYDDPAGLGNHYLVEFIPSNNPLTTLEASFDKNYDGNSNFIEYDGLDLAAGDTVAISLEGISENFYNYIDILSEQAGGDGGPFQTTPVKLKGNCKNINDPSEEVLGYFRLSEVDTHTYTIQ